MLTPGAAARYLDAGDAHALDDGRAVHARALGQRLGDARRVDIAVRRDIGGADHAVGGHDGEQVLGFPRADQMHFQPEALCRGGGALDLGPAVLGRGEPQTPDLLPVRVLAGLFLDSVIEFDAGLQHAGDIARWA
jgi:hypothetical protein